MDVRKFLDRTLLYAYDLDGKEVTVTIEKVVQGEVTHQGGKKAMPLVHFVGKRKPLGLNITNIKSIAAIVGSMHADKWPGHKITLYPTTTRTRDGMEECIRVKNAAPQ